MLLNVTNPLYPNKVSPLQACLLDIFPYIKRYKALNDHIHLKHALKEQISLILQTTSAVLNQKYFIQTAWFKNTLI